jgi:hypothetical protein
MADHVRMRIDMKQDTKTRTERKQVKLLALKIGQSGGSLFLPGALLVAVGAKFFAPLVFVDFRFATFLK